MGLHAKLRSFSEARHKKAFSKYLYGIEKDLKAIESGDFDVIIASTGSPDKLLGRLCSHFFSSPHEADEVMVITTFVASCAVEIAIPISKGGAAMPYSMYIELPVPIRGEAEFRRGALGSRWHTEPKNSEHVADLKRILPKVIMKEEQAHKGVAYYSPVGYRLESLPDGNTLWIVHSGYEGGFLTGGHRPRIQKYLSVIPALRELLTEWDEERTSASSPSGCIVAVGILMLCGMTGLLIVCYW